MQNLFKYQPLTNIELSDTWPNIIWREQHHCGDTEYSRHLLTLITGAEVRRGLWLHSRPPATEVEVALRQSRKVASDADIWDDLLQQLAQKQQTPDPVGKLVADLQQPEWTDRFIARHTLVAVGGEAIPQLTKMATNKQEPQRATALWLLQSIEFETTARLFLYATRLLCPRCLVFCHANWSHSSGRLPFVHYGCRNCGQSREFLEWTGQVVTVLDVGMTEAYTVQNGIIRGNWLIYRTLFDCNWVEIINTTDEDVERFAVQAGNDTDALRAPVYEQMRCLINPNCQLSKSSVRILQSQFGYVEQMDT